MTVELARHQIDAVEKLRNGSILVGGVGSGKSRTALTYYFTKVCGGKLKINGVGKHSKMTSPKDIFIITTARKRDEFDWEKEAGPFLLSTNPELSMSGVKLTVDSWNNIEKYTHIKEAFFIFDEQRVIGNGVWVKSFLKLARTNQWILLSATPGDTWMDYIPVFLANGFYKNRTEFIRRHVVYSRSVRFPKVDRYLEIARLVRLRDSVIVNMHYNRKTFSHEKNIKVSFNKDIYQTVMRKRWNIYEERPIRDASDLCYILRRVVNSDPSRVQALSSLFVSHPRLIVFYNFNYERDILLKFGQEFDIPTAQWNGHKHEPIPDTEKWLYIVQYAAGAEGWNCIETNVIVFFSQNYSYKATIQAAGRIDRMNTPFTDLYYYYLRSSSAIDIAIKKAFDNKRDFNERRFADV